MRIILILLLVNMVFATLSCRKNASIAPKIDYITFIQDTKDTLRFDSASNVTATYNLWNNTFYSRDIVNDFTCIMSDTLKKPSILINFKGRATGQFDQLIEKNFIRYIDAKGNVYTGVLGAFDIWVTTYGAVGSQVRGEFTAVLKQTNLKSTVRLTSGAFSAKRKPDYPSI